MNWEDVRSQFPALRNWTYFNTATFGQLPERAVAAINRHFQRRDEFACQDFLSWFDDVDRLRALIARLINAAAADIAFIPNASSGLSMLLSGLTWKSGDEILTLENEFPNHYYLPPELLRLGVKLVQAPFEEFYGSVNERTQLVAMSTVSYATGFRAPIVEIGEFLRARSIPFYLDGTQSVGALRFDVQEVRPDVLAVNGYKWLCSPNGAGFMYVAPDLRARLDPSIVGWRSDKNWRDFAALNHGDAEFSESAEKYEGGMLAFAPLYGMAESVSLMLEIGTEVIESRVLELASQARHVLTSAGAEIAHPDTSILAARFPDRDAAALVSQLRDRSILAAARQGRLRLSTHFYNNEADIEQLGLALKD